MANVNDASGETKRSKVAERDYIGIDGSVVDGEEEAAGVRYKHVRDGETVELMTGAQPGSIAAMLAAFGAKTWIGNVVSQFTDRSAGDTVDWDSVRERIGALRDGEWPGRAEGEGPGSRLDRDALAEAIVLAAEEDGHPALKEQGRDAIKAQMREKCEDQKWAMARRRDPRVASHYVRLVGKAKPLGDLLGL